MLYYLPTMVGMYYPGMYTPPSSRVHHVVLPLTAAVCTPSMPVTALPR